MTANHKSKKGRNATRIDHAAVDSRTQFVRSLRDGMKHARMSTKGKPSAARLALSIGRDERTARRVLAGEQRLDWETLRERDPKLWAHFLRCLMWNERKARVI